MTPRILAAAALAGVLPGLALAQARPELGYGVNFTSNYIFRGTTQSDDKPAVQGYAEATRDIFYGGVWASTVDFPDDPDLGGDDLEFDLYAGIRPSFGDVSLDLGYVRYLYNDSGDCCGEITVGAGYPIAELGEVEGGFWWDPDAETTWTELGGGLFFAEVWEVGGGVGTDFGSLELGDEDKVAWNLGVGRSLGDIGNVDLRLYDSNYDPGRAVVSIGLDF